MEREILISKLCNAFQPNAEAVGMLGLPIQNAINSYKNMHGGLWVGGRLTVTETELAFCQNGMNRALHTTDNDLLIKTSDIKSVKRIFGFLTGIIVIETNIAVYKLRCFGAKKVAGKLNELIHS